MKRRGFEELFNQFSIYEVVINSKNMELCLYCHIHSTVAPEKPRKRSMILWRRRREKERWIHKARRYCSGVYGIWKPIWLKWKFGKQDPTNMISQSWGSSRLIVHNRQPSFCIILIHVWEKKKDTYFAIVMWLTFGLLFGLLLGVESPLDSSWRVQIIFENRAWGTWKGFSLPWLSSYGISSYLVGFV